MTLPHIRITSYFYIQTISTSKLFLQLNYYLAINLININPKIKYMVVCKLNLNQTYFISFTTKQLIFKNMEPIKTCNCRASKCAKAYCQCFAARQYCHKGCHCIDCLNHDRDTEGINRVLNSAQKHPPAKDDQFKISKGCACKKSGCMKKYCECFNAGLVCSEMCKCVECQNTDSSINRKVIADLKRNDIQSNPNTLYRVLLAHNQEHLINMSQDIDKDNPDMKWLQKCTDTFAKILQKEEPPMDPTQGIPDHPFSNKTKEIIDVFLAMLKQIESQKSEPNVE